MFVYKLSLNRIHDRLRITEGDEHLDLRVDADPMRMVAGLNEAQKRLQTIKEGTPEDDTRAIALYFASVMFGDKQAQELLDFYHDDAGCVINVCGMYFKDRLAKLIEKAQKKIKQ